MGLVPVRPDYFEVWVCSKGTAACTDGDPVLVRAGMLAC